MSLIIQSVVYQPRFEGEKFLVVASASNLDNGRCVSQHSIWAADRHEAALKCCELARLTRERAAGSKAVACSIYCTHCPTPAHQNAGRCLD
jgi:hypothetical protein